MVDWIDVNDQKPNQSERVLISNTNCDVVSIGYYLRGIWFVSGQNIEALPKPTHYAKLPTPPVLKQKCLTAS